MEIFCILTGLSAGIICGSAISAFYLALGVFSKLGSARLRYSYLILFISSAAGVFFGASAYIFDWRFHTGFIFDAAAGLCSGIFTGIYIACIAEVIDLIPIVRALNIKKIYIEIIILTFALGKTAGSFVYWLSGFFR
jgi:stage V sporulation protein AB